MLNSKAKGDEGFENQIDKLLDLAEYFYSEIEKRNNFEIAFKNVINNKKKKNQYIMKLIYLFFSLNLLMFAFGMYHQVYKI